MKVDPHLLARYATWQAPLRHHTRNGKGPLTWSNYTQPRYELDSRNPHGHKSAGSLPHSLSFVLLLSVSEPR